MTRVDFDAAAATLEQQFDISVTSATRTRSRNAAVGGSVQSFHLMGMARDYVWDNEDERKRDVKLFRRRAKQMHLQVISEGDHDHVEPA
jgi:hypothetical protein